MKPVIRRLAAVCVLLGATAALGYAFLNRVDPADGIAPDIAGAPKGADVLARGEYLARMADCVACHTVAGTGKPFAGGVAFPLPFGTIYSSNITSDAQTGIGSWSDEQFVHAVRDGIRNDGKHLYPAFPYTSYTALSRDDVLAIRAYLASVPKVSQPNRDNDLGFPFNQRWAMGFWNAVFFKNGRFVSDPSKPAAVNSGAYLATALAHCSECHTPRNLGFGLEHGNELAGEVIQGWRAWNITPDPVHGVGNWSNADLVAYLSTGHAAGRGSAMGPMGEAVEHSLQYLHPDDAAALVAYLRTVRANAGKDPVTIDAHARPMATSSDLLPAGNDASATSAGKTLFEGSCASCHQYNGAGQQTPYAALAGSAGVNDPSGQNVTQAILHGVKMRVGNTDVFMPAFGKAYTDAEVAALANYVVGHFGGKAGTVTAKDVAARRKL